MAFLPTTYEVNTFWGLVWVVAVTDYVAKFGTVFVKILVVSMPACVVPFQKRVRICEFMLELFYFNIVLPSKTVFFGFNG